MQNATDLQELSAQIAESIARKLAAERDSGRVLNGRLVINLAGLIEGDQAGSIDFGSFDLTYIVATPQGVGHGAQSSPDLQLDTDCSPHNTGGLHETPRRTRTRSRRPTARVGYDEEESDCSEASKRRKLTGGLRLAPMTQQNSPTDLDEPDCASVRQLQATERQFPQRKAIQRDEHAMKPSTLGKLIVGIWEQIFSSISFDMSAVVDEWHEARVDQALIEEEVNGAIANSAPGSVLPRPPSKAFSQMNILCRKISQASRVSRALEVIVQARWVEHFDDRVDAILRERSDISQTKAKMAALSEACRDFGWTEKELRNKTAIWRGYKQIKDAGGWVCLVFAGMGIYRFCKYRISFDQEAMQSLRRHKSQFEVAADTLHPHWREMLSIVDAPIQRLYTGHPHDWVLSDFEDPIPLKQTYLQWDPQFAYTHLDTSVVDVQSWGAFDPRLMTPQSQQAAYVCNNCGEKQSEDAAENHCRCFPNLYGSSHVAPFPVQVYRTKNGKNNGLVACCAFERGQAIGEFIGLVTKGLEGVDIMQAEADQGRYQIWQGREGNHTRFVNHSCRPNSQFQRFVWMGIQRIVLVSRGIEGGQEITADYSDAYWRNLEKICLCNEACCRFKDRARIRSVD